MKIRSKAKPSESQKIRVMKVGAQSKMGPFSLDSADQQCGFWHLQEFYLHQSAYGA
jgi:hypothetical protein